MVDFTRRICFIIIIIIFQFLYIISDQSNITMEFWKGLKQELSTPEYTYVYKYYEVHAWGRLPTLWIPYG